MNEERLHRYVDDALSEAERAEVDAWLAANPDARARVDGWRAVNAALHREFDGVCDEPHTLQVPAAAANSPRWTRWAALAAAAVVGAGIGFAGGVLWRDEPAGARAPFARQAALAHVAYRPEVRHPVEVDASDTQHLVAWLSKRLDAPLRPPKLDAAGFRLLGGRLLPATSDTARPPVALLMYEDAQGRRLSLVVRRDDGNTDTAFRFFRDGSTQVFYWIDRPFGYALAAEVSRDELLPIAQMVYRQLNP